MCCLVFEQGQKSHSSKCLLEGRLGIAVISNWVSKLFVSRGKVPERSSLGVAWCAWAERQINMRGLMLGARYGTDRLNVGTGREAVVDLRVKALAH